MHALIEGPYTLWNYSSEHCMYDFRANGQRGVLQHSNLFSIDTTYFVISVLTCRIFIFVFYNQYAFFYKFLLHVSWGKNIHPHLYTGKYLLLIVCLLNTVHRTFTEHSAVCANVLFCSKYVKLFSSLVSCSKKGSRLLVTQCIIVFPC
jgi:hypothetical protein